MEANTPSSERRFTAADVDEAKKFGDFFIDLLDVHRENFKFYLAESAILDWFGRTIKGPRNIEQYLKNNAGSKHCFTTAKPAHTVGFREGHVVKYPSKTKSYNKARCSVVNGDSEVTPPQKTPPGTELGQGDGVQNCESPTKKCKLDCGEGDGSVSAPEVKYLTMEGHIEFRKKSSKKLQGETRWSRPCKLEVAYSGGNFNDCLIYLIIYQGNMKCRRNLLKEFESCGPDD